MKVFIRNFGLGTLLLAMTSSLAMAQDRPIDGADCVNPAVPTISANASENMDNLLDAQDAVQGYIADSNAFIECVDGVIERRMDRGLSQESIDAWTALINANVDAQQALASAFNEQVAAFRANEE